MVPPHQHHPDSPHILTYPNSYPMPLISFSHQDTNKESLKIFFANPERLSNV